jgi:hypothetical protein
VRDIGRRAFITLLGGAAAAWPLAARAQQQPKMLRVGFVGMQPRDSPLYSAFLKRMAELGYQEGRNFTHRISKATRKTIANSSAQGRRVPRGRKRAGAACRTLGRGRLAYRVSGRRFRPSGEWTCDEPVTSRGQCDRHFRTPARVRRQTRRDRSRGVPARDHRRHRI